MKRKVVNAGKLRLSPNEEALILKEDYERRRKLRLLQVREQERGIASQRREDIKHRRNQQLIRLAEDLREEWEEAQTQKIQNLEKLYLASLRSMGAGHRQAKENEPDLDALAWRAAERKRKAEMRHKEALKVQRNQKELLMKQKTWHIKARKDALLVEKERSAKVTSLPPPVPSVFENIEVKSISSLKTNSSTYHHLSSFVTRQMDTEQPDAHLAAEEAAKRLEELQKQAAQEREKQFERAHVRGTQAMKKIQLAQNQEKLMKELKQLQQEDLARRRQTVAQMPPQLVELPYKRSEIKEDWQRELEFAFEDMYNADRKVKGNLILHLEPEPLPAVSDQIQDEELDLSMEQENEEEAENVPETDENLPVTDTDKCSSEADVKTQQIPSKVLFKRLLNKIRNQKSLWTIKSTSEDENETAATISETESQVPAVDLGAAHSEEGALPSEQEQVMGSDILTIESGPLSEDKPLPCQAYSGKGQEVSETPPVTAVAQSSVLLHPQEEAARIRMSARHKQIMEIEEQKQKQLELLEQIEQQKLRLETDCFRAQLEEEKRKKTQQTEVGLAPASCDIISDEDSHRQIIRNYQQQLLQQNRLHRQSVETARKRLLEYQTILKRRYPSMSATSLTSDSIISVPPWKSEKSTTKSEHRDQSQRLKLSPNRYRLVKPIQIPKEEQGNIQEPRQNHFPQSQAETAEALSTLDVLAKQRLESQDHLRQFQLETQQRDYKLIPKDSHTLSRALSYDRPQTLQDARKIPETFRATTFQSLDSQQILSVNSESVSSKPTELSSFLPLVPEHSFICLPVKGESGKIQEPFSNISKSAVSINQSVINQVHGQPMVSSETITAQQGNLKALQEQLELRKEILQARQEAQEQLLLCKQQELEEQNGLSALLPVAAGESFVSLPPAKGGPRRIQESPARNVPAASSGHVDEFRGVPEPILSQQNNVKFFQEQFSMQRDNLQARREAQEVLFARKQSELDGRIWAEQTGPHQVALHPFTSLPFADGKSRNIQEQHLPKSEKELLSSQSEIPISQVGSSSFLQQFLPLHDSLKLLQHQLTSQEDMLQARHNAQVELLLQREKDLGDSKSGPVSSSFSSLVSQKSVSSHTTVEAEPRRFQKLYSSEKENIIPSGHLIIPTLQDKSLIFPQHSLPKQENVTVLQEQSHIQEVIPDARKETWEFVHKQSEQTSTSSSPSQVTESERFQEFMSIKSDNTGPLSDSKIPRFRERLLRFSQHILPLQGDLGQQQEWLDTEKEVFQVNQQTQENISSKRTGLSSLIPQLGQPSCMSLPSVGSGTTQELSTESDSKITSSHFQIPELQNKLMKISQLIQPRQDNLKALQEQLATQREVITQARREALEEALSHKQKGWRGEMSPEQVSTSSPPTAEHSFVSLPLTKSEKNEEFSSNTSDNTISSSHSEMLILSDRALGDLPHTDLPQQGNPTALQAHLHAQTNPFPCTEKIQKEFLLPMQCKFEENVSSRHLIPPHLGHLKALQQKLDMQQKSITSGQEVQEELILQRLTKLEERVSSEQSSSIPFSSQLANSERTQKSFPARGNDPGILRSQGRLRTFSQPLLPQHDHLTLQLDVEREELLLNKQNKMKSESAECVLSSLCLSEEIEHSFIPLPFAEAKPKNICELGPSKNEHTAPSSDSVIPRFQDRHLSFSQPVLTQQENMSLQKQLDLQREVLHSRQKAQEELLIQRQTALQQQIQKHQETLKDFFHGSKASKPTDKSNFKMQTRDELREWLPHIPDLVRGDEESTGLANGNSSDGNQLLSEDGSVKHGEHLDKALGTKASKPPVAKVICGLDLNQHELSTIQEVESPASGKTSIPGKRDFYQDRDPLRVSVSREQNFLASPLARDPFGCCEPPVEAVKVKEAAAENHALLSYAVSEDDRYLGPALEPNDKAKTQELSHESSSSVTVSTGSFLSHENTDLSLTEPESFSELDHQELESTTSKHTANNLSSVVPSSQTIYEQNSSDVHESLLSHEDYTLDHIHCQKTTGKYRNEVKMTPEKTDLWVDFDFPELEHIFPNLHRQLFKPLEPHLDVCLSSSSSGNSQDNRDFHQSSESSFGKHLCNVPPASTFTALGRTCLHSFNNMRLNPQPDTNQADQSFATENTEGSEQSFQQLLPECSSQESQHADLPSIYSIEARDVEHTTPCGSISGECSAKLQSKAELGSEEHAERKAVTTSQHQRLAEDDKNATRGGSGVNSHVEDIDSQLCVRTVETSEQAPHSLSVEDKSSPAQAEPSPRSESLSLQSSIPIWETESGHGIMEEPELTLVSISDISIAETDFANLALEEQENEAKSYFQTSGFLPLVSESSDYPVVSAAMPESLQEAFAKRKKSFMERSYQRQREIQNKARASANSQTKTDSFQSHRGVSKERKTAQSAPRLCNQLAEVKQQKEQKARQEVYAQNRARAKEFHKKTLAKLRAKNTC